MKNPESIEDQAAQMMRETETFGQDTYEEICSRLEDGESYDSVSTSLDPASHISSEIN